MTQEQSVSAFAQDFHARHEGILLPDTMSRKNVVLFGAGSLGSLIGSFLIRAGLCALELYDNEHVEAPNLSRTLYRHADIGRRKVEALGDILREIRPDVAVREHHQDLHELSNDELFAIIEGSDLVVAATDHPPTQARVAALSYWRKPAILPGVYERATGGEVLFTIPDMTACWYCVFNGIRTNEQPNRGEPDYGVPSGQLRAVPALGADIATVAVVAARVAIALLHLGSGLELERMLRPQQNIVFLGNTIDWAFADYCENFWARTTRRPDCPVCRQNQSLDV